MVFPGPVHGNPDLPEEVVIGTVRVSTDGSVARILDSVPVLPQLVEWLQKNWSKPLERAKHLGNGVRAGPNQLPHLYAIVQTQAAALGIQCPELFVAQQPELNAFTFGTNDDACIVVHSALIDLLDEHELEFILGHEMGHIKARHVTYSSALEMSSSVALGLLSVPLDLFRSPIDAWKRATEETADRIGVVVSHEPLAAVRALGLLAVGSRKLLKQMDLMSYLEQHNDLEDFYGKLSLYFGGNDHPHLVTRVMNILHFVRRQEFLSARNALRLPANIAAGGGERAQGTVIEGTLSDGRGGKRFCPGCGFEINATETSACMACGLALECLGGHSRRGL